MFGFSGQDLIPTRETPNHPFLCQFSRLLAHLASANLPPEAMFILNATTAMAFNKVQLAEQQTRIDAGLPPKLRPVKYAPEPGD